ncbi:MAG: ATP-binding protein [Bacteroidetes bacterium]|nr:ATP-binding protein [Bacteroidota bacterium]
MLSEKIELNLTSVLDSLHQVEKFVENICDEFNINNTYFGNILIVLTEAVENAIIHGNKNNPAKVVSLVFISKPEGLSFSITDEGNGFDTSNIPDPTDISQEEIKGRGIFLIKSLADEIIYSNNGKTLEVIFKISSINNEMATERINMLKKYSNPKEISSIENRNKQS